MRAPPFAGLLVVLALASTSSARSWVEVSVAGTILPGSVRCRDGECSATLRAARLTHTRDGIPGASDLELEVSFDPTPLLVARDHAARWVRRPAG